MQRLSWDSEQSTWGHQRSGQWRKLILSGVTATVGRQIVPALLDEKNWNEHTVYVFRSLSCFLTLLLDYLTAYRGHAFFDCL